MVQSAAFIKIPNKRDATLHRNDVTHVISNHWFTQPEVNISQNTCLSQRNDACTDGG